MKQKNNTPNVELEIPDDCLRHIYEFLNHRELVIGSHVNHKWRNTFFESTSQHQNFAFYFMRDFPELVQYLRPLSKNIGKTNLVLIKDWLKNITNNSNKNIMPLSTFQIYSVFYQAKKEAKIHKKIETFKPNIPDDYKGHYGSLSVIILVFTHMSATKITDIDRHMMGINKKGICNPNKFEYIINMACKVGNVGLIEALISEKYICDFFVKSKFESMPSVWCKSIIESIFKLAVRCNASNLFSWLLQHGYREYLPQMPVYALNFLLEEKLTTVEEIVKLSMEARPGECNLQSFQRFCKQHWQKFTNVFSTWVHTSGNTLTANQHLNSMLLEAINSGICNNISAASFRSIVELWKNNRESLGYQSDYSPATFFKKQILYFVDYLRYKQPPRLIKANIFKFIILCWPFRQDVLDLAKHFIEKEKIQPTQDILDDLDKLNIEELNTRSFDLQDNGLKQCNNILKKYLAEKIYQSNQHSPLHFTKQKHNQDDITDKCNNCNFNKI